MSTGIILEDFKVGQFTFRHALDLPFEQREKVIQSLQSSLEEIPETTKCEGELHDPRCPESGTGDVPNIALAAFSRGRVVGAIHLGSIKVISESREVLTVEIHGMPAFPDLTPEEEGDLSVQIALFLMDNELPIKDGRLLKIVAIRWAIENTNLDNRVAILHDRFQRQMNKFNLVEAEDTTRAGRKLFELKKSTTINRSR